MSFSLLMCPDVLSGRLLTRRELSLQFARKNPGKKITGQNGLVHFQFHLAAKNAAMTKISYYYGLCQRGI